MLCGPLPPTPKHDVKLKWSGLAVNDPYLWLEQRSGGQVDTWVRQQNARTQQALEELPQRRQLLERFQQLMNPREVRDSQTAAGLTFTHKPQASLSVQGPDGVERTLVELQPGESVSWYTPSPTGRYLAVATANEGKEDNALRVVDVATGKVLPDAIPDAGWNTNMFAWSPEGDGYYYSRRNVPGTRYHKMGTANEADPVLIPIGAGPYDSMVLDERGIAVCGQSQVWVRDRLDPEAEPVLLGMGKGWDRAQLRWVDGRLYALTRDQADNGKLECFDPAASGVVTVLKEDPDLVQDGKVVRQGRVLRDFTVSGSFVCGHYLKDASSQLVVTRLDGGGEREIPLPSVGTVSSVRPGSEGRIDFTFSSLHQPPTNYSFNPADGSLAQGAPAYVPGYDPSKFTTELQWSQSPDGTRVPLFLVHRKDVTPDGDNPTVLYGYGGFNSPQTPAFNLSVVPFLESGGVYAVAGLRGGAEFGEDWHRDGMLEKKQNVFTDAAAAARTLIDKGWTSPDHLGLMGGSNGGLMVGAVATQNPGLFEAAVARVPLMDMLRYDQIDTNSYVGEFGSAQNPQQAQALAGYSPYHNVKDGVDYPAMLITTGRNDARVSPAHARKMAARLQQSGNADVWLKEDLKGGHGPGRPVAQLAADQADEWSFLLHELS